MLILAFLLTTVFVGVTAASPLPETAFPDVGISDLSITTYAGSRCDDESKTWPAVHYGTNQGKQFHSINLSRDPLPNERLDVSYTGNGGDFCANYVYTLARDYGPGLTGFRKGDCMTYAGSCFRLRKE